MKVRYINALPLEQFGYDPGHDLIFENTYHVFGMVFRLGEPIWITLRSDVNGLFCNKKIHMFEILDPTIPDDWCFYCSGNSYILEPMAFKEFTGDFWEHYFCNDPVAEEILERVEDKIKAFHLHRNAE